MTFDIRPALPKDPPNMNSGMNIWGRVEDTKHHVTTSLGTRSRGFVWFFSFLAWYSQRRKKRENIILLLDEPGLSLHAKAQEDLLRYFENELRPYHQLIYTTHSPFMVDPAHFEHVRIVQNLSIEPNSENLAEEQEGTKVITEVLDATPDSLFPLQGALGYEICQTLFHWPQQLSSSKACRTYCISKPYPFFFKKKVKRGSALNGPLPPSVSVRQSSNLRCICLALKRI